MRGTLLLTLFCTSVAGAAPAAPAASIPYPERPVRFIVPFPPGAANDFLARLAGQKMTEAWGQPVIIDNRGGAGGTLGTALAAKAQPDGYTIVLVPATHAINVSLYSKPLYDAVKDFEPVTLIATGPYMLVVNPSVSAASVKDLIALAKAKPGALNYGSAGTGNATHLIGELVNSMAGIQMTHVPYKGVSPALADVVAGRVQLMFGSISATQAQARAGKVRALAVTSAKRSAAVPDVPTLSEAGIPGFDAAGWWGVLAPAGTNKAIVGKMSGTIAKGISSPETRRLLESQGFDPVGSSPEQFGAYIRAEIQKWGRVVQASGAKLD
jgi:tripartite-type tricarboxylate transporter receptor subunit TctC